MSAAVAILDALRKKPVAEKKKEFSVAFFVANSAKPKPKGIEKEKETCIRRRRRRRRTAFHKTHTIQTHGQNHG